MFDPIGGLDRVKRFYLSYVETAFRIDDPAMAAARRRLLEKGGTFALDPVIELVFRYKQWSGGIEDLAGPKGDLVLKSLSGPEREAFAELALSGLFGAVPATGAVGRKGIYSPYVHQVRMLERGLADGAPGIVTSGTGSGKTEAFMLPVLARLAKEARTWPATAAENSEWYARHGADFELQRRDEHPARPKALRAMILYPMNALVEDQMVRLRKALDSDDARSAMRRRLNGNRIFFARYNGETPVTGFRRHPRLADDVAEQERVERKRAELGSFLRDAARAEREVTREWLLADDEARFFLVMDELHLVRGSGGGEIAGLLRMLFLRLGLTEPEHRHKLRILASSASLPIAGEGRDASLRYLWDMFGTAGTHPAPGAAGARGPEDWEASVVEGQTPPAPRAPSISDREALRALAERLDGCSRSAIGGDVLGAAARALTGREGLDRANLTQAALNAAGHLAAACSGGPRHAAAVSETIFREPDLTALRGLMALRAIREFPPSAVPDVVRPSRDDIQDAPAFRVHGFFRSIEGLFASVSRRDGEVVWGIPSVERGQAFDAGGSDGTRLRRFELLYCESCGELFVGGRRGGSDDGRSLSMLPSPQDLEALPENSSSGRFEDANYDDFAIFWPRSAAPACPDPSYEWQAAILDPYAGTVRTSGGVGVPGRLLRRKLPAKPDQHKRMRGAAGTAMPYCCPRCATDYSPRYRAANSQKYEGRLSPLRSFRTGFGKTSQLLATELVTFLKAQAGDGKLVAFSDSRGDAARLALDLEEQHQRDLRRELLVGTARESVPPTVDSARLAALDREFRALAALDERGDDEDNRMLEVQLEKKRLKKLADQQGYPPSVALAGLLEFERGADAENTRPVLSRLIAMGANPEEGADHGTLNGRPWESFFEAVGGSYRWKSGFTNADIATIRRAKDKVMGDQAPDASDLLFSKTYFALEETGLGWPSFFGRVDYGDEERRRDAMLRVFSDAYRVLPNRFMDEAQALPRESFDAFGTRFRDLAAKLFVNPRKEVNDFIGWLSLRKGGVKDARIDVTELYVRLAEPTQDYLRCGKCARVHLHEGVGRCTRCATPFGAPVGKVSELQSTNYLGARVERSHRLGEAPFRLRTAELTGQSGEPSQTLRRFKGICVRREDESEQAHRLRAKAEDLDLVSVTTTMEVGVDIGALEAVYQGNMPPQRFNYQQRVGRAGRRGQAFSAVVTVCRSRSHDLHYFRYPLAMTGEAPPPPFVTTGLQDIPSRLLRKFWLASAFTLLREEAGDAWAGDAVRPPDIHGEFVYCDEYFAEGKDWQADLRSSLERTVADRDEAAELLADASGTKVEELQKVVGVDAVLADVAGLRPEFAGRKVGLASALAESGLIPLYGLPTRARNLYVGLKYRKGQKSAPEWDTIDREQDIAIHEFAPGSVLVRDKKRHLAVGFTGSLAPPSPRRGEDEIDPWDDWVREEFSLGFCARCGNWERDPSGSRACSSCGSPIGPDQYRRCLSPAGYRTDFRPRTDDERATGRRDLTLATVGRWEPRTSGNLELLFEERALIHKVNAGALDESGDAVGFHVTEKRDVGAVDFGWRGPMERKRSYTLTAQAIAENVPGPFRARLQSDGAARDAVGWLVSSKVTNALHITPISVSPLLRLAEVEATASHADRRKDLTSVRAAAISATQIVVLRASLDLDVSPDEFEALAPRSTGEGNDARPFLQIADTLLNGSGFCRHLQLDGRHAADRLIHSVLGDLDRWPLCETLKADHLRGCDQSCYGCVQRYGNRRLHGLLDWRLGLAFLRAMVDADYVCGLDDHFSSYLELGDWRALADRYAKDAAAYMPGARIEELGTLRLPSFTVDAGQSKWVSIVHPLWRRDGLAERLALPEGTKLIDTFELARRPIFMLDRLRD